MGRSYPLGREALHICTVDVVLSPKLRFSKLGPERRVLQKDLTGRDNTGRYVSISTGVAARTRISIPSGRTDHQTT